MPNWCNNFLFIEGKTKELKRFKRKVNTKESALDFEATYPTPESPPKADGLSLGWYTQHWGTKWNSDDVCVEETKKGLSYSFLTAWSPPCEWVCHTSKQFPNLTFKLEYEEGGVDLYGESLFKGGECLEEKNFTYREWLEQNEDYVYERENIANMDPNILRDKLLKGELSLMFWPNEENVIKRLKREDLPLFLNQEWINMESSLILEQRLKGG